jgi:hypothetical protein
MINVFSKIGLVLVVLILGSLTLCSIDKLSLNSDPNVAPAFEQAKLDAKTLLGALDAYHAQHGFYPRSRNEVPVARNAWHGFLYVVSSLNRVYGSLDCAGRVREFQGPQALDAAYLQRKATFLDQCVQGYSNFTLKSPRIETAWRINASLVAFAQFTSNDGAWNVGHCKNRPGPPSAQDCRRSDLDDDVSAEALAAVGHGSR